MRGQAHRDPLENLGFDGQNQSVATIEKFVGRASQKSLWEKGFYFLDLRGIRLVKGDRIGRGYVRVQYALGDGGGHLAAP